MTHFRPTEDDNNFMFIATTAIAVYLCATMFQVLQLRQHPSLRLLPLRLVAALAIGLHGYVSMDWVFTDQGLDFGLFSMSTTISFTINLIVLASSFRKPAHNLFLLLFPLAAIILAISILMGSTGTPWKAVSAPIGIHIFISILAYSLMTIAAVQAILLALQNWRLRHKRLGNWLQVVPPLQTMEALLFEVLWAGFILLTLSLITGFLFFEDFFAQHLAHKSVFSICSWLFYAILLWGRHVKGWRGNTAIRWTLIGFSAMVLAYWGSKFVIEVVLS
ncbi:cytochrome C assembly family protein [Porticoccus sp.]